MDPGLDLLKAKHVTEGELRKNQPTALTLLALLKRNGIIGNSYDAAERLAKRGNTVMHKGLYEDKVLPQLSLGSIGDLVAVSTDLDGKW